MPTVRTAADYEQCVIEILRAMGGRATRGTVLREFERRHYSSLSRADLEAAPDALSPEPPWQRSVDHAARTLIRRKVVALADHDLWDLT